MLTDRPTIIEAAARAMADRPVLLRTWDTTPESSREWYREVARAALTAVAPLIRAAALEEAAQVAHDHGRYSQAYLDGDLPDDLVIHNHACWDIRDKLRALKEQP